MDYLSGILVSREGKVHESLSYRSETMLRGQWHEGISGARPTPCGFCAVSVCVRSSEKERLTPGGFEL